MRIPQVRDPAAFVEAFLEFYLGPGLGSRAKREVDAFVVHLLETQAGLSSQSNQQLSLLFKLSASRVATLRYEAKLRFMDPRASDEYLREGFLVAFLASNYDGQRDEVTLAIEDKYLRALTEAKLKELGTFSETAFNRELLRLPYASLEALLHALWPRHATHAKLKVLRKQLDGQSGAVRAIAEQTLRSLVNLLVKGALSA